jgi:xyloglucan-specific exo-beta-1,4-glucanase
VKRLTEVNGVYSWVNVGIVPQEYESQGGYDQTLIVDGNMIIVGGMDAYHSTNSGNSWYKSLNGYWSNNQSDGTYIHSDHHAMGKLPGVNQYWSANDGGLSYISYNANNRNFPIINYKSDGVINTQMYSVAINPLNNDNNYITGNQDNDSFSQVGNAWYAVATGDGIQSAVNYNNPAIK